MAVTTTRPPLRLLALVLGVVSCEHTQPFQASPPPPITGPLTPSTVPVRLTYNPGNDAYPSWLLDGSGILYQAENPNSPDRDRCLVRIPPPGGTVTPVVCDYTPGSVDTVNAYGPAAASPAGRVAFYEAANPVGLGTPLAEGIYLTPSAKSVGATLVVPLPMQTPSGVRADKFRSLRWLGDSGFLALAVRTSLDTLCGFCALDTLETGIQVLWVGVRGDSGTISAVPGTEHASSYAFVAPDTIYFTKNDDNRIWRTERSGGPVDSVYGFPPDSDVAPPAFRRGFLAVARGVQVLGNIAYAVTGGRVYYFPDSGKGEAQRDWGGDLHKVTLSTGADTILGYTPPLSTSNFAYIWMRNPVLSPDGRTITAEGRPALLANIFAPTGAWIRTDTTVAPTTNLWQYVHP